MQLTDIPSDTKGKAREAEGTSDSQLYLERLQTLFDKGLSDLQSFAERESRPFQEVGLRLGWSLLMRVEAVSAGQGPGSQVVLPGPLRSRQRTPR